MFQSLATRRPALEEMDRPDIAPAALEHALRALVRMNSVSLGANLFWPSLREVARERGPGSTLNVLDVGCGAGDMSRRLEQRAAREGFSLKVDGCDMNTIAVAMANREGDAAGTRGKFFILDVIENPVPEGYDAIISSLFLHHLSTEDAQCVLGHMAEATRCLVLASDLIRSRAGLALVYLATRTLTRSPVVHRDGVTSLLAAFTMEEALNLGVQAGMTNATISRRWPERFVFEWRKPA
jgi:2-polyprenyl-3-methyl-5-hydroxy-6-metoxy-1,4-benzoquinol methylase